MQHRSQFPSDSEQTIHGNSSVEEILLKLVRSNSYPFSLIACFYTGKQLPSNCAPMPREPEPPTGISFDETILDRFQATISQNPAIHDGAVMIGRPKPEEPYVITGWSYRLFPSASVPALKTAANKGSAFNSCLAMSMVTTVDRLYHASKNDVFLFRVGTFSSISL